MSYSASLASPMASAALSAARSLSLTSASSPHASVCLRSASNRIDESSFAISRSA